MKARRRSGPLQHRGLLTTVSVDPPDIERVVAEAARLGVEIVVRPSETYEEIDTAVADNPDADHIFGDVLPGRPPGPREGGFSRSGAEEVPDLAGHPILAAARNLRWVQITSAGVNQELASPLWLHAPWVTLTTSSGLPSLAMAQYIGAMILRFAHHHELLERFQAGREWSIRRHWAASVLFGRTLGILGYGGTGRRAAHIGRSLGLRVIALRRQPDRPLSDFYRRPEVEALDGWDDPAEVWPISRLNDVLAAADFLACTLPLTPSTRGLLGRRELALMKPTAVFINVSRGAIFDGEALLEALRTGRLAGAALDVFETEPLAADSPLFGLPNVVLTPHVSGIHVHVSSYSADLYLANLARFVSGRPLLNVASRSRSY